MEPTANPEQMIQYISQPAFLVKDGIVIEANRSAETHQIKIGAHVNELITLGSDEYRSFFSGKLYLELKTGRAWVSNCNGIHLFCMEDSYSLPELRAFALAAQHLRTPLSNAVSGTELLIQNELLQNDEIKKQLGQINRSLYQLIRTVCNMSDVAQLGTAGNIKFELENAASVFSEIFEKAANLAENADRTLKFHGLKQSVSCVMDVQLLERAVLNLISNAIKFSPTGSTIQATLNQKENRLSLTIENSLQDGITGIYGNAFRRFLREPGIEGGHLGIGIGMSIVSRAVAAHGGTVLLNTSEKNSVKIIVSIPIRTTNEPILQSNIVLLGGYTGGIDHYLIELSDVLPDCFYETI